MKCTIVKQLPNHCVPASLVSVAIDSGNTSITQEEIVKQFPGVFPNGVLEDIGKIPNLRDVVKSLGLADEIYDIPFKSIEQLADLHSAQRNIVDMAEGGSALCQGLHLRRRFSNHSSYEPSARRIATVRPSFAKGIGSPLSLFQKKVGVTSS